MARASHPRLQGLKLRAAPWLWRLLAATVRVAATPRASATRPGPVIFACLHRDFLPALLYVRRARPVLLVSHSPDGDVLRRTLAPAGFDFARGSTGKRGAPAFARLLSALREGRCVGVAVDGPRGPFGEVREGVVLLSRLSGCPIVTLRVAPGPHWRLRTWDRTVVPAPGSRVALSEGPAIQVPADASDADLPAWGERVARVLRGEPA